MIPKTISGFKHEVVQLSPSATREVVDFVLPKHALAGCEAGIVDYCGAKKLLPHSVGVKLPVTLPGSQEKIVSILSSRHLLTMKLFYLARYSIAEAKLAMEWVKATSFSVFPSAPFDDYADYTNVRYADCKPDMLSECYNQVLIQLHTFDTNFRTSSCTHSSCCR